MKKIVELTALFVLSVQTIAWCQTGTDATIGPVAKLNTLLTTHVAEKAYLHFDKPYYAAGDTIYFKAYVTQGERHELSKLSGVLHIDLVNTANKTDQALKLYIDGGIAMGDFVLPDSLPAGNYRVRAYTQWMKNDGEAGFFDKVITIGSAKHKAVVYESGNPDKAGAYKADIQFFPEGGYLVNGIRSKIAFKAVGTDGKGIDVKGTITDNNNTEIGHFASAHLGMGSFYFLPEDGKTYKASVTFANGAESTIDLPVAENKGMVLAIDNRQVGTFYAGIFANKAYFDENKGKTVSLLIYSGGETSVVNSVLDNPQLIVHLPKSSLKTGVAQVTLFNANGEPLNERLAFIQNPADQLNLSVQSAKPLYQPREKVKLDISSAFKGGMAAGHFSISVIDEGKVPADENDETTILSYLLLSSDLKGYVEQPNFYFTDTTAYGRNSLDVLMLTQGYRRFAWKQVMDNSYPAVAWQPEKGLEIDGAVKSLFGKRIAGGTINLIPAAGGPMLTSTTDSNGEFHFRNLLFNDTTHFVLSAVNTQGQNSTKIEYFDDKPALSAPLLNRYKITQGTADTTVATYLNNTRQQQDDLLKYGRLKGQMLKEVKIKQTRLQYNYRTQSLAGAGNADQIIHADELERVGGTLTNSLSGRLRGITFTLEPMGGTVAYLTNNMMSAIGSNIPSPMMVVVDGAILSDAMNHFDINSLNVSSIETIEVLKSANASIYGFDGASGVLVFTTKQGGGLNKKDIASIGVLPIAPMGFYKAREFYSPKYDNVSANSAQRDLRSTIYWKPELATGVDGHASIEYYNADGTGTYKVIVEGIDDKGNLGRQVYQYKVGG